jgi:hypothetical protein
MVLVQDQMSLVAPPNSEWPDNVEEKNGNESKQGKQAGINVGNNENKFQ